MQAGFELKLPNGDDLRDDERSCRSRRDTLPGPGRLKTMDFDREGS